MNSRRLNIPNVLFFICFRYCEFSFGFAPNLKNGRFTEVLELISYEWNFRFMQTKIVNTAENAVPNWKRKKKKLNLKVSNFYCAWKYDRLRELLKPGPDPWSFVFAARLKYFYFYFVLKLEKYTANISVEVFTPSVEIFFSHYALAQPLWRAHTHTFTADPRAPDDERVGSDIERKGTTEKKLIIKHC